MAANGAMDHADDDMDFTGEHGDDYRALVDYGINTKVANELEKIYNSGEWNEKAVATCWHSCHGTSLQPV